MPVHRDLSLAKNNVEFVRENFSISTDKSRLDLNFVHEFLKGSYWAQDIPLDVVRRSIDGSMCFGLYYQSRQIGFARVITDTATFAYLADVFIEEKFRGNGLSKWLVQVIVEYPELQGLRRFMLATRDDTDCIRNLAFHR